MGNILFNTDIDKTVEINKNVRVDTNKNVATNVDLDGSLASAEASVNVTEARGGLGQAAGGQLRLDCDLGADHFCSLVGGGTPANVETDADLRGSVALAGASTEAFDFNLAETETFA